MSQEVLQEAIDLWEANGRSFAKAVEASGLPRGTYGSRLEKAKKLGMHLSDGARGAMADAGPQGIQGLTGATGPQGPAGVDGAAGLADAPIDNDSYARRNGAWIPIPRFLTYVKTSDQEVVNSNAYVNDFELVSETLLANAIYRFELMLCYTAGAAEDMRFRIARTGLTDADFRYASDLDNSAAPTLPFDSNTNCAGAGANIVRMGNYIGFLITGTSTGTITVQWAQQIAGVTPTTMRAGSMMALRRVV